VILLTPSGSRITVSERLAELIEQRMRRTIRGIEETLREALRSGEVTFRNVRDLLRELEPSFALLSQRWVLEILYSLLMLGPLGFNELKRLTGASSRSLSSKLRALVELGYVSRSVRQGPPLRTLYSLTDRGRGVALLSLPVLYYISGGLREMRVDGPEP